MWQIYKRLPVTFGTNTQQMVTGITNTGDERRTNEPLNLPGRSSSKQPFHRLSRRLITFALSLTKTQKNNETFIKNASLTITLISHNHQT